MKNSDQPINPCIMQQVGEDSFRVSKPNDPKEWNHPVSGLTKREYFAGMAMQATDLEQYAENYGNKWAEEVAKDSVIMADALLKQLEQ